MRLTARLVFLLISVSCLGSRSFAEPIFRYHLAAEPSSLAPNQVSISDGSAFLYNLYRGLYSYSNENGLRPEGAEKCSWSKDQLTLTCTLSKKSLWSDGNKVEAADYVRGWRELFSANAKSAGSELLLRVKNAEQILKGEKKKEELGVEASNANTVKVYFAKKDPEFLYKLALVPLVPIRTEKFVDREHSTAVVTNGPYKISDWKLGRRAFLSPNENFHPNSVKLRPKVEVLFIDEDLTALNLYESGELSMLRRLPTQYFAKYSAKPEFKNLPVARFDYMGFGMQVQSRPHLRKALALSADYNEFQKIVDSPGTPGCPCLSEKLFDRYPCVKFNLTEAKRQFELSKKTENLPPRLQLSYSQLGGDSVQKGMEWFQAQWKKNLGISVELQPVERGIFLQNLKLKAPDIYRKGLVLSRPTCLAALETFVSNGPENFFKFSNSDFDKTVAALEDSKTDGEKKKLCTKGVSILVDQTVLIPLGRFYNVILVKTNFSGWTLNELNQLDLTNLKYSP